MENFLGPGFKEFWQDLKIICTFENISFLFGLLVFARWTLFIFFNY